ncbi:Hsp70 family protein [Rhodococcoides yunnanense]|uniref:Hsp70 family protein n=1 Tax=Rhodococcoides yunnanense TaxID=278209 RepID=A0ABU4B6P3_9NOCA|nr:Hsp70 family protein [Rhodococcus yunnanensis]MDV6259859.1 Hsp70 family protein [Rhodococcus yunnanensis]
MSGAGHLGITVGNTRSVAVHRVRADDEPTVVVVPTTLRFDEDGRAHLGEPADTAPFTRFVDLVGQQEDLEPDAAAYRAEDLMANAANCLVTMMSSATEPADAPVTTMTYPTRWPRESVALLRDALDHAGLTAIALVPDAKAASTFAQRNPGTAATVIDIGATGTDISTYPGGGTVRTTAVSGDVFTDALFDHVVTDREHIDLSDAAVLAALAGVVASCEAAKHALSTDEHATISVDLPGLSQTTTVTRAEFADLVAPSMRTLDVPQTGTVVLTGGSAELESVAAEIAERTSGRLVVEPLAAPRGALLLAEVDDVDGNSLVTGAAPIVTRNDGTDSLDTDAIPVVPPEKSLAFSEAIPAVAPVFEPSEFRSQPVESAEENASNTGAVPALVSAVASTEEKKERSERSRTITTVIAGAAAGVVIVLAIAAVSGVFSNSPAPTPPAVTDAGSPVVTSTRTPSTTTSTPAPAVVVPEVVEEQTYEPYIPPQPAPLPAPPPAPIPTPPPVVATTVPVPTTTPVTTTPAATTTTPATTTPATTSPAVTPVVP